MTFDPKLFYFAVMVSCAVGLIRTTLANWMAQNRPVDGQKFNLLDGFIDFMLTLFYIYGMYWSLLKFLN